MNQHHFNPLKTLPGGVLSPGFLKPKHMNAIITNVDYWQKILKYWKEEKEIAIVGSIYYGKCCSMIGILEDIFKCIEPLNNESHNEISDDEIEKAKYVECAGSYLNIHEAHLAFIRGANWYRNKIKIANEMYKKEMQNTFISDEEFNKIYNDLTRVYTLPMYKDISNDYQNGYLHGVLWLYTFLKNKQ
jgi:hypothetical protein